MKIFMMVAVLVSTVWAELYPVFVSGVDMDLYMTGDGYLIQTMMCTVTGNDIEAVLDYERLRPYGNELKFEDERTCQIVRVFLGK
jgi:hypothetical protein